jgi:tripartite-type tricarboxylate transporter receptor subunit TctC
MRSLLIVGLALSQILIAKCALAQTWPQEPVRIVVSFGAGGGADIVARIIADALQGRLGKPVVVENKPGAGGILGNEIVADAAPDGYTLGIMTAGQIIAATMRKEMPYDTSALTPVSHLADASLMIVTYPDFPAENIRELIAAAKVKPAKIVFASAGFGATQHFAGELFKQAAGINLLHVPFRSSPEAINAVVGKQADVLFDTVSALIGQVRSGALKAIAVTGRKRIPAAPDVPTAIESGLLPDYDVTTWYGVFGPPKIPTAIVNRINRAVNDVIDDEKVRARLIAVGVAVRGSTALEFGSFMSDEYKRWNAVREAAGIARQ